MPTTTAATSATFTTYAGHTLTVRFSTVGRYLSTDVEGRRDTLAAWDLANFRAAVAGDDYYRGSGSLYAYLRVLAIDPAAVLAAVQ